MACTRFWIQFSHLTTNESEGGLESVALGAITWFLRIFAALSASEWKHCLEFEGLVEEILMIKPPNLAVGV